MGVLPTEAADKLEETKRRLHEKYLQAENGEFPHSDSLSRRHALQKPASKKANRPAECLATCESSIFEDCYEGRGSFRSSFVSIVLAK